jgi:hypothetical protein
VRQAIGDARPLKHRYPERVKPKLGLVVAFIDEVQDVSMLVHGFSLSPLPSLSFLLSLRPRGLRGARASATWRR